MQTEWCKDVWLFYNILVAFEDCFPYLKEKVTSLFEYAQKVINCGNVLLAMENGKVIGLCAFYDNDETQNVGYITLIGVKKDYRNRQVGRALLTECEEVMKTKGMKSIKLEVDNDNVAKFFYMHMGYKTSENAGAKSHYMIKQL